MFFKGLITALVTPFLGNELDEEGLRENIRFQVREGVDGLLFLGSTGEGNSLSSKERMRIIEIALDEGKGRIPLLFSCGGCSTEKVLTQVKEIEKMGGDGILCGVPYYTLPTQEGLYSHFETIAKKSSLPVILYNHPYRSGVSIKIKTLKRLRDIKTIIGIKDCSGSIAYGAEVMHEFLHLQFFGGDDLMALPFMSIGGQGLISTLGNLIPKEMKKLINNQEDTLFQNLYPLMKLSQIETNPIPIKAMMNFSGLPAGECRLPLTPLSLKNEKLMRDLLNAYV